MEVSVSKVAITGPLDRGNMGSQGQGDLQASNECQVSSSIHSFIHSLLILFWGDGGEEEVMIDIMIWLQHCFSE